MYLSACQQKSMGETERQRHYIGVFAEEVGGGKAHG
jgi:hypothetical protein